MARLGRVDQHYENLKLNIAYAAQFTSYAKVAQRFGVTEAMVRYHYNKYIDPNFHPGTIGGPRNCLFDDQAQLVMELVLWELVSSVRPGRQA